MGSSHDPSLQMSRPYPLETCSVIGSWVGLEQWLRGKQDELQILSLEAAGCSGIYVPVSSAVAEVQPLPPSPASGLPLPQRPPPRPTSPIAWPPPGLLPLGGGGWRLGSMK